MSKTVDNALSVLRAHGIDPYESEDDVADLPEVGTIEEGEMVYTTSIKDVLSKALNEPPQTAAREWDRWEPDTDDERLHEWWRKIRELIRASEGQDGPRFSRPWREQETYEAPEPLCAWYSPIHYFGHGWGIYIRESCIFHVALDIAAHVNWAAVMASSLPPAEIMRQLLRSAFYVFFLHEQFHHKVESLGFRLLVTTGTDRYRPYKTKVYRPSFLRATCLEETLANAESYRRLTEERYKDRHAPEMLEAVQAYLAWSIPKQPPGYAQGMNYVAATPYRRGLYTLQSQVLDGSLTLTTPATHWSVAPDVITSLMSIDADIYVILPVGARPIFRAGSIDPGATASTAQLTSALTRHYGYSQAPGGNGSHVKLVKPNVPNIHLPGNRPVVSPGMVKQVLGVFGGYPLSRLPDLLRGQLPHPPRGQ